MASDNTITLLDDYLANRLTGNEKAEFEQKLQQDPELQSELKFQQELIQGVRQARIAELKAMLNSVPVSPVNVGTASVATKVISTIVVVGVVSSALYLYLKEDSSSTATSTGKPAVDKVDESKPEESINEPATQEAPANQDNTVIPAENSAVKNATPATQPKLEVYTPETETDQLQAQKEHEQLEIISRAFVTSSIEVEAEKGSKKYGFHYMFKDNKLILFGSFENNLYEILEFIAGDQRTVFLFYNNTYYLLDLNKTSPTELVPIKDKALLNKLRQYRGN